MGEPDEVATRGDGPPHGAGGAAGLHGMSEQSERPTRRQRWLARLAFAAAIAAVVVLLLPGGLKSITALLLGFAGLVVACAAAWWFLAKRGIVRWLACVVLVAAPVFIIVVYVVAGLLWEVVLAFVLAAAAAAAGRARHFVVELDRFALVLRLEPVAFCRVSLRLFELFVLVDCAISLLRSGAVSCASRRLSSSLTCSSLSCPMPSSLSYGWWLRRTSTSAGQRPPGSPTRGSRRERRRWPTAEAARLDTRPCAAPH